MGNDELIVIAAALLAATAFAGVVYALIFPFLGADAYEQRLAGVKDVKARSAGGRTVDAAANRRKQVTETLKDLEKREKAKQKVTLRLKLERAGLDITPRAFWIASAAVGVGCMMAVSTSLSNNSLRPLLMLAAAIVGTFGLPRFILDKLIVRRQNKFLAEFANALDIIVRGVKSGLPLNDCLNIISSECPEPISTEFREVVEQMRIGVTLGDALERMTVRVPLQEVKFFAIVIAIQQQSGGNLAEALGNLSTLLRDRFKMQMKIKALSSEAKASALILGSLPPGVGGMLHIAAPDYVGPLFTTHAGNLFLLGGAFWMSCGILVMRKMINFKF